MSVSLLADVGIAACWGIAALEWLIGAVYNATSPGQSRALEDDLAADGVELVPG